MKSYTDLEQSKKLAEILPLSSADMCYGYIAPYEFSDRMYEGGYDNIPYPKDFMKKNPNFSEDEYDGEFPCWSLAALLGVLPTTIGNFFEKNALRLRMDKGETDFNIWYEDFDYENFDCGDVSERLDAKEDNPIDACYEMILKLHEQKLL